MSNDSRYQSTPARRGEDPSSADGVSGTGLTSRPIGAELTAEAGVDALDVIVGVVLGLLVNEASDVSPWLAHRIARLAAFHRAADPAEAEERVRCLAARIDEQPGKLAKLWPALVAVKDSWRRPKPAAAGRRRDANVVIGLVAVLAFLVSYFGLIIVGATAVAGLGPVQRCSLLTAAALGTLILSRAVDRRGLTSTGSTLWMFGMLLVLADAYAVWDTALLGVRALGGTWYTAGVVVLVTGLVAVRRRWRRPATVAP